MAERRKKVIRIALILVGIGALYAVFASVTGVGIPCPIRSVTGLKCPGCGVSRMALSVIKLDFASAFGYNAAVLCLLPLMAATAGRYIYVYVKYGRVRDRAANIAVIFMIVVLVAFGVLRNVFNFGAA